jgi:hypothetical protein
MTAWIAAGVLWVGATLILSGVRPLHRPSLIRRLRPYLAGGAAVTPGGPEQLHAALLLVGERLDRLLRVVGPLPDRLAQAHHPLDPGAFRFRQLSQAMLALVAVGIAAAVAPVGLPPVVVVITVLGTPIVVVALHEQTLAGAARRRTRQVVRELPTVAEQLAMLLGAGRSVPAAVAQLSDRGRGACADDLGRVARALHQGVGEAVALQAWADLRRVPAVSHLVGVLALAGEATDLERLVEQEAEAIRTDAHRDLLAALERRGQQVWIPVTVATLLPGSMVLLVPFLDALRLFAGT